jgi:hypothetical protein
LSLSRSFAFNSAHFLFLSCSISLTCFHIYKQQTTIIDSYITCWEHASMTRNSYYVLVNIRAWFTLQTKKWLCNQMTKRNDTMLRCNIVI